MAAELFVKYSGQNAFSAGTKVFNDEGETIGEILLAEPVIRFMKQEGVEMTDNVRT